MYKVVFWRFGDRKIEEFETKDEAHKQFNFIGEYEQGFVECVLDQNNMVIRENSLGIQRNRNGKYYNIS